LGLFHKDTSGIRLTVSALTDVGKTRQHNEDRYLVADLSSKESARDGLERDYVLGPKGALLLVADGMGGALAGEVASQMATDLILESLAAGWVADPDSTPEGFARHVRDSIERANAQIHHRSMTEPELDGMGTTATLVGVLGTNLLISQVGDSRAYLVREGVATQVSRDQSYVQHLIDTGRVSEQEARQMASDNVILQALGPQPTVEVVQTWEPVRRDDVVLLCSDGLSGLVGAEEIGQVVARGQNLSRASKRLVKLANSRGGPDNITVIIARMGGDGMASAAEPAGGWTPGEPAAP